MFSPMWYWKEIICALLTWDSQNAQWSGKCGCAVDEDRENTDSLLPVLKLAFLMVFLRIFVPFLLEAKNHNIPVLKFGVRNFEVSRSHFRR